MDAIKSLNHSKHWNDYKLMQLHPNPKQVDIPRNYQYYYSC